MAGELGAQRRPASPATDRLDPKSVVLQGSSVMQRSISGALQPVRDGEYTFADGAQMVIRSGAVVAFTCLTCPPPAAAPRATTLTKPDNECVLEARVHGSPNWSDQKWPAGGRLDWPFGNTRMGKVGNISTLRLVTVELQHYSSTLEVGEYKTLIDWGQSLHSIECGEPDPVVVAQREAQREEEAETQAMVDDAAQAVRDYLNDRN